MTKMSNCEHGWSFTNTMLTALVLAPLTGAAWYAVYEDIVNDVDLGNAGTLAAWVGSVLFPSLTVAMWNTKH